MTDPKDFSLTETAPAVSDPEAVLARARQLIERTQFSQAAELCLEVLEADPDHREALYVLAVAYRYRQDLQKALAACDRLLALEPTLGRAHQERAHTLRDLGDRPGAFAASPYQRTAASQRPTRSFVSPMKRAIPGPPGPGPLPAWALFATASASSSRPRILSRKARPISALVSRGLAASSRSISPSATPRASPKARAISHGAGVPPTAPMRPTR